MQLVEIVEINVKFHLSLETINQFIVTIVFQIIDQQETTVDAEDISHF